MKREGLFILAWILSLTPGVCSAQTGRAFVSLEAFVGQGRAVHLGTIEELAPIDYAKPLTDTQKLGKPHRLVFKVSGTIKGDRTDRLQCTLSLQRTIHLQYLRRHSIEIMLVTGAERLSGYHTPRVGIEEQGRRVDGQWYHFRLLAPLEIVGPDDDREIARQINLRNDSGRIFTNDLKVIEGREVILERARAFAGRYPEQLASVSIRLPRELAERCGNPNAYCNLTLPVCPEVRKTLTSIWDEPDAVLGRIQSRKDAFYRKEILKDVRKALAEIAGEERR
jgi:hypothetical protein